MLNPDMTLYFVLQLTYAPIKICRRVTDVTDLFGRLLTLWNSLEEMDRGWNSSHSRALQISGSQTVNHCNIFCHRTDLSVSLTYGFRAGCKMYHLDYDLRGFMNRSKPPALVEQLEYLV